MTTRRDLSLDEKLKILVRDLPLSKEARNEYAKRGVYTLHDMVKRFHKNPGVICLPFITHRTFTEGGYLVVKMGFDASNDNSADDCFVSRGVGYQCHNYLEKKIKEGIDSYVNEKV